MKTTSATVHHHTPWNKGKLIGQKSPLKLKDIWAIRIRLQIGNNLRELAMFNLALDSKLRACDLVRLRPTDICHGSQMLQVTCSLTCSQDHRQKPALRLLDPR